MSYNEKLIEDIDLDREQIKEINLGVIITELNTLDKKSVFGLSERETFVVRKRYGFYDNGQLQSYSDIAKLTNVTSQTVRLDNFKALRIIKKVLMHYSKTIELNSSIALLDFPEDLSKHLSSRKSGINKSRAMYFKSLENNLQNARITKNDYDRKMKERETYIAKSTNSIDANELTIGDLIEWITGPRIYYHMDNRLLRIHSRVLDLATIIKKLEEYGFDVLNEEYLKNLKIGEDFASIQYISSSKINGKIVKLEDLIQKREDLKAVEKDLDQEITELYNQTYSRGNNGSRKK